MTTTKMTYTAALRAARALATDFVEGADLAVPLAREDVRAVVHHLIGEQTGAFREAVETFEDIWTAAGGSLVWAK